MSRPEPNKAPSSQDRKAFDQAGIAGWSLLMSATALRNGFAQDDVAIIQESPRLHGLGSLHEIFTMPYWPPPASPDLYRPLTSLWLALQYAIGNGSPLVFRAVSILMLAATAVMAYRLAIRILPREAALVSAAIFAVHPVHVEAVSL